MLAICVTSLVNYRAFCLKGRTLTRNQGEESYNGVFCIETTEIGISSGKLFHVRHVNINESVFPGTKWERTAMKRRLLYDWSNNMGAREYDVEDGHIEEAKELQAKELQASHFPTMETNTEDIIPTVKTPT